MRIIIVCCKLIVIQLLMQQPCLGSSFFEMDLSRDSFYTPGKMSMTMKLTNKAKMKGNYNFKVSIYVADTLTRKKILPVTKTEPVAFEIVFPEVRDRTDVRCRVELFINGQFIEAKEKPLTLWPSFAPYQGEFNDKVIWSFDISGKLQQIFDDLRVEATDATFQAARSFEVPDIVFVGQDLDPNSLRVITDSLELIDGEPVIIYLKQKRFLESKDIEIPQEDNRSETVICDLNSPILQGLNKLDIMNMVKNASYIRTERRKDQGRSIDSHVTGVIEDGESIYSYLLIIEEEGQVTVYCQLPVTDSDNPICGTLLKNFLTYAHKIVELKRADKPL